MRIGGLPAPAGGVEGRLAGEPARSPQSANFPNRICEMMYSAGGLLPVSCMVVESPHAAHATASRVQARLADDLPRAFSP